MPLTVEVEALQARELSCFAITFQKLPQHPSKNASPMIRATSAGSISSKTTSMHLQCSSKSITPMEASVI
ncbi:hypothetical protein ACHAW5_006882 [Stephanodiscus triporus]|uniref:Uncharacterized protein n=1 Tax=Stephanodiscus triporus TaxID=2934178 RepID=A0ABD3MUK3_9STRA